MVFFVQTKDLHSNSLPLIKSGETHVISSAQPQTPCTNLSQLSGNIFLFFKSYTNNFFSFTTLYIIKTEIKDLSPDHHGPRRR